MKKILLRGVIVFCILAIGIFIFKLLNSKKTNLSSTSKNLNVPLVETLKITTFSSQLKIRAQGVIEAREIGSLTPQVSGKVLYISPKLKPGSTVKKGELLLKIDPKDYQLALAQAQNNLIQAESNLILIQAQARQAIEAYKLEHGPEAQVPPLIAKEPELKQALANKEIALTKLKQAELNLKRTELFAPYDLVVLEKKVGLGTYINAGTSLATYYALDSLEVKVPLEPQKISYLSAQSRAQIYVPSLDKTFTSTRWRPGPQIEESTRLIDIYLQVNSPLLKPGEFVQVTLLGKLKKGLAKIPVSSVHDLNTVWILTPEQTIEMRPVKVWEQEEDFLLVEGLKSGTEVVTTPLGEVSSGLKVRVK
ncbi:MAG: rane fusion protein multidrug efflux system [Desulfonauticus sp.]|jgi:RND family efflux transporter MFP subunit|nr:rane fusion protein multidrug efflux system [Desulfonauticus sp.]